MRDGKTETIFLDARTDLWKQKFDYEISSKRAMATTIIIKIDKSFVGDVENTRSYSANEIIFKTFQTQTNSTSDTQFFFCVFRIPIANAFQEKLCCRFRFGWHSENKTCAVCVGKISKKKTIRKWFLHETKVDRKIICRNSSSTFSGANHQICRSERKQMIFVSMHSGSHLLCQRLQRRMSTICLHTYEWAWARMKKKYFG